jgi:hypothetical protein
MLGSIDGGTRIRNGRRGGIDGITGVRTLAGKRRVSTPLLLQAGMVLACIPVVAFALAVHVGLTRNDNTVQTVGEDATGGITIAQRLKLNLAELDSIAVRDLLVAEPLSPDSGYPADYNTKRTELHENLVSAAAQSPGAAYEQTLANIDYVLGHYHALLADSFAANAGQDPATALAKYDTAHQVMSETLLPEADRFDKANTYVLNDTYGRQKERSTSTMGWIGVACAGVVVVLLAVQITFARAFHRILNFALIGATVLAIAGGVLALDRLQESREELSEARDHSFDSVHQLSRARAVTVMAQQAQGDFMLHPSTPGSAEAADERFHGFVDRLFRLPRPDDPLDPQPSEDELVAAAGRRSVPRGSGGYFASVVEEGRSENINDPEDEGSLATRDALKAFADFVESDQVMRDQVGEGNPGAAVDTYRRSEDVDQLVEAIDTARRTVQDDFDDHVDNAESATSHLRQLNFGLAAVIVGLIIAGFYTRLREYTR